MALKKLYHLVLFLNRSTSDDVFSIVSLKKDVSNLQSEYFTKKRPLYCIILQRSLCHAFPPPSKCLILFELHHIITFINSITTTWIASTRILKSKKAPLHLQMQTVHSPSTLNGFVLLRPLVQFDKTPTSAVFRTASASTVIRSLEQMTIITTKTTMMTKFFCPVPSLKTKPCSRGSYASTSCHQLTSGASRGVFHLSSSFNWSRLFWSQRILWLLEMKCQTTSTMRTIREQVN